MSSTTFFLCLCAAVGACRLIEMTISRRHQRALGAQGAPLVPEPIFGAMVALHTGVIAGAAVEVIALHRPFVPPSASRRWRWWCWPTCCASG